MTNGHLKFCFLQISSILSVCCPTWRCSWFWSSRVFSDLSNLFNAMPRFQLDSLQTAAILSMALSTMACMFGMDGKHRSVPLYLMRQIMLGSIIIGMAVINTALQLGALLSLHVIILVVPVARLSLTLTSRHRTGTPTMSSSLDALHDAMVLMIYIHSVQ